MAESKRKASIEKVDVKGGVASRAQADGAASGTYADGLRDPGSDPKAYLPASVFSPTGWSEAHLRAWLCGGCGRMPSTSLVDCQPKLAPVWVFFDSPPRFVLQPSLSCSAISHSIFKTPDVSQGFP